MAASGADSLVSDASIPLEDVLGALAAPHAWALALDERGWELKEAAEEYAPVLCDEFERVFGERRESVLDEEMTAERVVLARHLLLPSPNAVHVLFGNAGVGKSALLSHLHARVALQHDATRAFIDADGSARYYNAPTLAPAPLMSLFCRADCLSVHVDALADPARGVAALVEAALESADVAPALRSPYSSLLLRACSSRRVFVLVDSLERLSPSLCAALVEALHALQRSHVHIVRSIVASRALALLQQRLLPATYIYLSTLSSKAQTRVLEGLGAHVSATVNVHSALALALSDAWLCRRYAESLPSPPQTNALRHFLDSLLVRAPSAVPDAALDVLAHLLLCALPVCAELRLNARGVSARPLVARTLLTDALVAVAPVLFGAPRLDLDLSALLEALSCAVGADGHIWPAHLLPLQLHSARFLDLVERVHVALSASAAWSQWSALWVGWAPSPLLFAAQWRAVLDALALSHGAVFLAERLGLALADLMRTYAQRGIDVHDRGQILLAALLRAHALRTRGLLIGHDTGQIISTGEAEGDGSQHVADSSQRALSEALGEALLSAIKVTPAAVMHVDALTVHALSGLYVRRLAQCLVEQLQRAPSAAAAQALGVLVRVGGVGEEDVLLLRDAALSRRAVLRLMRDVALSAAVSERAVKAAVRVLIDALASAQTDVQDEAAHALRKLGKRAIAAVNASAGTRSLFGAASTWSLVLHSSTTLLARLVALGYHRVPPRDEAQLQALADDARSPVCRAQQCQHLPYIVSLLESSLPGVRLLAHLMLADVNASNNFSKGPEDKKLVAMRALLPILDRAWPSTSSDVVHEVSKHNALLHVVARMAQATLGAEAAQALVLLEALVHRKLDLLVHCSAWVWQQLSHAQRRALYDELMAHKDALVRVRALHLRGSLLAHPMALNELSEEQVGAEAAHVTAAINSTLLHATESLLVRRQALSFLADLGKAVIQPSAPLAFLRCFLDAGARVIETLGLDHTLISEPVLRILVTTLDARRGALRQDTIAVAQSVRLKESLIKALSKLSGRVTPLALCTAIELLQYLVDVSLLDDLAPFIASICDFDVRVRRVCVSVLAQASAPVADSVLGQLSAKLLQTTDKIICQSLIQVIGRLARAHSQFLGQSCLDLITTLSASADPLQPIYASTILSIASLNSSKVEQHWLQALGKTGNLGLWLSAIDAIAESATLSENLLQAAIDLCIRNPRPELFDSLTSLYRAIPSSFPADKARSRIVLMLSSSNHSVHVCSLRILKSLSTPITPSEMDAVSSCSKCDSSDCRKYFARLLASSLISAKKLSQSDHKLSCELALPLIQSLLADSNSQVVASALKALSATKTHIFDVMDLSLPLSLNRDDAFQCTVGSCLPKIASILQSRKLRNSKEVRFWLFIALAETALLRDHMQLYSQIVNSDQISTLVEFAEIFKGLGPQVLQYVPFLAQFVKAPGSPLVKHLVKLLQKAARNMTIENCEELFPINDVTMMLNHKDYAVRKIAVFLLGFKCDNTPRNVFLVTGLSQDSHHRVRKQIVDSLANLLRRSPTHLPIVLESKVLDSFDSLQVWKNISMASMSLLSSNVVADSSSRSNILDPFAEVEAPIEGDD